jgi:hypothetical protein
MSDEQQERALARQEILDELAPLLDEHLAALEWGRALVRVSPRPGGAGYRVTDIDIEELFGDDEAVDRAMAAPEGRALLPLLAQACEALCATFEVAVDEVEGGTWLRLQDGRMGFLPGLVHAPSASFERLRDERMRAVLARQEALLALGVGERFEVDLARGEITFLADNTARVRASATLLGSFARGSCTWAWAWANPSLDAAAQAPSRALCDAVPERDMWEISTPQFATDEGTAWALCAIVCEAAGGAALYKAPHEGGAVFFLLRDVQALAGLPSGSRAPRRCPISRTAQGTGTTVSRYAPACATPPVTNVSTARKSGPAGASKTSRLSSLAEQEAGSGEDSKWISTSTPAPSNTLTLRWAGADRSRR